MYKSKTKIITAIAVRELNGITVLILNANIEKLPKIC